MEALTKNCGCNDYISLLFLLIAHPNNSLRMQIKVMQLHKDMREENTANARCPQHFEMRRGESIALGQAFYIQLSFTW